MPSDLYTHYAGQMEDFWDRRPHTPQHERRFRVFGWPVVLTSDDEDVLAAADHTAPLYSTAPPLDREPFRIRIAVRRPELEPGMDVDPGPGAPGGTLPANLSAVIQYTGSEDWIHIDLAGWGQAFADLRRGEAVVVLGRELAARPDQVNLAVLNTLLTNFLTRHDHAMLHATGLVRGDRTLLLMAPHNSGKSTTALRLVLSGQYRMLTDSMVYVSQRDGRTQLAGFPVGRGKLRRDMLGQFPALAGKLTPEQVREETKFVLDLRKLDPDLVCGDAVVPGRVDWCLLSRTDNDRTTLHRASEEEAWESIMLNSLHYDTREVWEENLRGIEPLVRTARFWRLELGLNGSDVVKVIGEGLS